MLPLLAIVGYGYVHAWRSMRNRVGQISRLAVRDGTTELNHFLEGTKGTFEQWIGRDNKDRYGLHIQLGSVGVAGVEFTRMLPGNQEFYMLALTDLDGNVQVACARGEDPRFYLKGETAPEAAAFKGAGKNYQANLVVGGLLAAADAPFEKTYVMGYQTHDTSFNANGYLLAYLDWRLVRDRINEIAARLHQSELWGTRAFLVDHAEREILHTCQAHPRGRPDGDHNPAEAADILTPLLPWMAKSEEAGMMRPFSIGGRREYAAFWPLHDPATLVTSGVDAEPRTTGAPEAAALDAESAGLDSEMHSRLAVVTLIPQHDFAGEARRFLTYGLLIAVAGVGLTGGAIWYAGGSFAHRILLTVDKLKDVTRGQADLSKRMRVDSRDELGELETSMNLFLERLQQIMGHLRESQMRYQALYENSLKIVYEHDEAGRLLAVNGHGLSVLGYSMDELKTMCFQDLVEPGQRQKALDEIAYVLEHGVDSGIHEFSICGGDRHTPLWIQTTAVRIDREGKPPRILGVGNDITERKQAAREKEQLEEQLERTQRLEAIGRLAGGVAHDFNNILTGILGHAELLKDPQSAPSDIRESADVIEKAAMRAGELTRQLLGFARKGKLRLTEVDLHQVISEVIALLQRTVDKRIELALHPGVAHAYVRGDPAQLQQIIMNLAVNACDAMPDGGALTFKTTAITRSQTPLNTSNGNGAEPFLDLSVTDTGTGIAPELMDRIFEPFFSTKDPSSGAGMGLATVYGIVINHGGTIQVDSQLNRGTAFRVYLPAAALPAETVTPPPTPSSRQNGNGHHILIIDDERHVRELLGRRLKKLGYRVTTAENGLQAVDLYRGEQHRFDLVLLDMTMPEMNGRECFRELRKLNPSVLAILMTGHAVEGAAQDLLNMGLAGFLQKPFTGDTLVRLIEEALEQAPPIASKEAAS